MLHAKAEKKYRPNVAAIVLSSKYPDKCELFIAKRTDVADAWQFPQGGIDEGESPREALFRELKEEIGTNNIEIVGKFPGGFLMIFHQLFLNECILMMDKNSNIIWLD